MEPTVTPTAGSPTSDEKQWAIIAHVLNIVFMAIGPLIVYLIKRDQSKYVAFQALQAVFFGIAGWAISLVTCGVGWLVVLVFGIMAIMKINNGEAYEYPVVGKLARDSVYGK